LFVAIRKFLVFVFFVRRKQKNLLGFFIYFKFLRRIEKFAVVFFCLLCHILEYSGWW
jgi:hypothetical protein